MLVPERPGIEAESAPRSVQSRDSTSAAEPHLLLDQLRTPQLYPGVAIESTPEGDALHNGGFDNEMLRSQIARYELRHPRFVDRVVTLHAIGHSLADIERGTSMLFGEHVPADLIALAITDARQAGVIWSHRALEPLYPIVSFEALRMKWRDGEFGRSRLCHVALGYQTNGRREVLGVWFETGAEASFWRRALEDLNERGVRDILYMTGTSPHLPAAAALTYHAASVVPHLAEIVRRSLQMTMSKDRSSLAAALRQVHCAPSIPEALRNLAIHEASALGRKYPSIGLIWRRRWAEVERLFAVPVEVRRVMATIGTVEALRRAQKRALLGNGHLVSIEGAMAIMHRACQDLQFRWKRPQKEWHEAKFQLCAMFSERLEEA